MKPEDLSDFILNFVIAARDTSALTLSWFFYALGKHPEVVAKIRREMAQKLSPGTDFLTSDDAKRLTYLEAAIKETLRLYPGGPHTVKQVMRDTVICGDIFLRKGMMISINAWAVARNPRVWGPDASEFKPQRWINETTGEIIHVSVYKFVSFHAGPRSCAGRKLAMLNLRVVAANLLHRFAFDIDPANDGTYVNAPTLAMKHALLATVTPIGIIPSDRAYE
jgi:cytochrome P450